MATAHSIEPSKESIEALTLTVCSTIQQEVLSNHGKSKTTEPTQGEQTAAESNVAKVCDLMNEGDTVGPTTSMSRQNALGCHPDRNLNVLEKDNVTVAGAVSVEDKSVAGDCVNDPVKISACGRDSPRIETGQTCKDEIAEPMDCVDDSTGVGTSRPTCTKLVDTEKDETLTVLGSQIDAKGQLEQLDSPLNPQSVRSLAEQEPARTDVPESCEISEKTKLTLSVGNVAKTEEDLSTALVGGADTESVSQISPSAETCSVRSELSESVTESLNSAVDNTCSAETVTVPGEMSGQNSVSQSSSQISTIDAMEIKEEETKTQEPGPASRYDHLDTGDYNEEGVPIEFEEPEFVWEEYLEETGSAAVPPTAFKHVECSLQSGFIKGMKLEVPNKDDSSMFWVASVVMTCGPLLRLRYEGYEDDSSADFWCDLSTSEVHTIGWCAQNNKTLQPPEGIKGKYSDWGAFLVRALTGARTAPSYLLDKNTGTTPVDQIKRGMRLELQNAANPLHTWIVRVIENVGGRLYLRYEGADSGNMDFWLFYLDYKVHPAGWTKTKAGHSYHPPAELRESKGSTWVWSSALDTALREAQEMVLPPDVLKDQVEIVAHRFQAGYKLEALHPVHRNQVCPATVTAVLSSQYFTVTIDSLVPDDKPVSISCHARSPGIYPIGWCMGNGIKLTHPKGWSRPDFTWNEYLAYCRACAAPDTWFNLIVPPHEFERGLKLEAVNPTSPNQVCAATITKISDRLLWLHLDSNVKVVASHIEDIESHNLFPVGWCESNDYMLKPPRKGSNRPGKRVAVVQPERSEKPSAQLTEMFEGNSWCPKIYFNHRCFSGPYLSKGRIAELPKCVGPGPIQLVMKEVLSMLINVAYKSCRVLREIQMEGEPNPNMHQQVLKAKYKTKSYRAVVEICKSLDQLEEFCRQICIKLECCPNLISANFVGDHCPETCSQLTKTKYTYYYGKKKKKVGRPPGGHTNLENGAKKPGKRKKRKKITLTRKPHHHVTREESIPDDDAASVISESSESKSNDGSYVPGVESDAKHSPGRRKRKYTHHIPVPSAITTRGAKLPKFSFERKTHKKILCNSTGLPSKGSKSHHKHSPVKSQGEDRLRLHSNPLSWSIGQVVEFIKTTDCSHLARLFREHEIDGQALLLLTLPTVQEHMELKLGPAIKLCHHIERVKIAFYDTYAK